ncbi:putative membrane protein [Novosphingobium chloroacetimidivorans]|uniref:Putative membrane protein n=1 Tax=Novosphingobium chloroacetimidivorans TaxID=1428314 RepID=A0A7W7KCT9_9SPHN|nr:DUF1345 domain-containing protein [Novosphingobium chloroacetimidivorans]MBB4860474.1 putative membrane protein [Novosphingobium chloroacetimidivorans]
MADGGGGLARLGAGHPRYRLFLVVLVLTSVLLSLMAKIDIAILLGFDLAALVFILSCVNLWRGGKPDEMRMEAKRDDAGQFLLLVLTAVISTVVLTALGILLLDKQGLDALHIVLLVATLLASWTFANLVYAFHYARLFYSRGSGGDQGGLDFPGDCEPEFADFVNFAFVIGMTCQTADITITHCAMRRISTFHGLFAFAFNLGILALTVNVLASS